MEDRSKFENIEVIEKIGDSDIAMKYFNVLVPITRNRDDLDFWIKRLKDLKAEYILAKAETVSTDGVLRYVKGYVIFTKDGVL